MSRRELSGRSSARSVVAAAAILVVLLVVMPATDLKSHGSLDGDAVFPLVGVTLWLVVPSGLALLSARTPRVSWAALLTMLGTLSVTGALAAVPWVLYLQDTRGLRSPGLSVHVFLVGAALTLIGGIAALARRRGSQQER